MKNNRMPKIKVNYKPNGRRQHERHLRRILDEAEGLTRDVW
jgi:hypothetical protein